MKRVLLALLAILAVSSSFMRPNDQDRIIQPSRYEQVKKLFSEAWQDAKDDFERKVAMFAALGIAVGSTLIISSMKPIHSTQQI